MVLQGSGGDQWLVVAAPLFTIDGSLTLVDRGAMPKLQYIIGYHAQQTRSAFAGISISEGSTLVQKGSLHISVTAALRSGIKVDAGATWIQEGSVTITSGSLAEAQISLCTSSPFALISPSGVQFPLKAICCAANGIHLESTGEWHQYGELTLFSHGAIGNNHHQPCVCVCVCVVKAPICPLKSMRDVCSTQECWPTDCGIRLAQQPSQLSARSIAAQVPSHDHTPSGRKSHLSLGVLSLRRPPQGRVWRRGAVSWSGHMESMGTPLDLGNQRLHRCAHLGLLAASVT